MLNNKLAANNLTGGLDAPLVSSTGYVELGKWSPDHWTMVHAPVEFYAIPFSPSVHLAENVSNIKTEK